MFSDSLLISKEKLTRRSTSRNELNELYIIDQGLNLIEKYKRAMSTSFKNFNQ